MPAGAAAGVNAGWVKPMPPTTRSTARCTRVLYAMLGVFLGWLGIHNFVAGYNSRAVTQLVLGVIGVLTSGCVVGIFILLGVFIWAIVDVVTINKDVDGIAMD
jgi:TM2 domain-containing membrane protein YozV